MKNSWFFLIFHIFCSLMPSQVLYSFHVHGFVLHAPQQQHMDAMVDMISLWTLIPCMDVQSEAEALPDPLAAWWLKSAAWAAALLPTASLPVLFILICNSPTHTKKTKGLFACNVILAEEDLLKVPSEGWFAHTTDISLVNWSADAWHQQRCHHRQSAQPELHYHSLQGYKWHHLCHESHYLLTYQLIMKWSSTHTANTRALHAAYQGMQNYSLQLCKQGHWATTCGALVWAWSLHESGEACAEGTYEDNAQCSSRC